MTPKQVLITSNNSKDINITILNSGGDSDSSNDEGLKEEVPNVGVENAGFSLVSNQMGAQNMIVNGQVIGQRGPLAVINEIDDRKNKKKKPIVLTSNKKKPK